MLYTYVNMYIATEARPKSGGEKIAFWSGSDLENRAATIHQEFGFKPMKNMKLRGTEQNK